MLANCLLNILMQDTGKPQRLQKAAGCACSKLHLVVMMLWREVLSEHDREV